MQKFNTTFSGTTAVIVLIMNDKYFTANVGDSRAIMVKKLENHEWKSVQLSNDHKPDLPIER